MSNIRTDVKLAPLGSKHVMDTVQWLRDPSISENIGLRSKPTVSKTTQWIEGAETDETVHAFAIKYKSRHIGNAILDKYDNYLSTARFSIYIGDPNLKGAGVGQTATFLLCKYGFEEIALQKVWLTVHPRNVAAIKTYRKIGFQLEGTLRGEFLLNNERINAHYMGLLKQDFDKFELGFV